MSLTPHQRAVLFAVVRMKRWAAASDIAASTEDGYLNPADPSLAAWNRLLVLHRQGLVERDAGRPVMWRATDAGRAQVKS